jgi:2-methylcitrate dehydratase PrpD
VNTAFEQIPPEAIQMAKGALLDGLGVAIAGSQTDIGRIVTR